MCYNLGDSPYIVVEVLALHTPFLNLKLSPLTINSDCRDEIKGSNSSLCSMLLYLRRDDASHILVSHLLLNIDNNFNCLYKNN